jgi:hypothetical protein
MKSPYADKPRRGRPAGQARLQPDLNSELLKGRLPLEEAGRQIGRRPRTMKSWIRLGMPVHRLGLSGLMSSN